MHDAAFAQKFKGLLFGGAGLIVCVLIGSNIGSSNYMPAIMVALAAVGLGFWFLSGKYFWVITIASSFLLGTFPILGGAFTPFQLLVVIGLAKFVIEEMIFRRRRLQIGNRVDAFLICGFMVVLTLHGLHDRFGMRFLGSSVWGGHNYVNVYVGLAAFFVIQSVPMGTKHWRTLPYLILAVVGFDLFIAIITTIFPSSIYRIYPFYSAVSVLGIEQIVSGEGDVTGRVGAFGSFGFALITLVLAATSLKDLFHPRYLFRALCLAAGFVSVLFSGFRSSLINAMLGFLIAGIRDLKFKMLALFPVLAVLLLGLSFINSEMARFPKQVQRALSFVPGDWDPEMAKDAANSNEFRTRVWRLWSREYFTKQPLLGRGFGFRSEWAKPSIYYQSATDYEGTVEVQNLHNGLFAALDTFGVIGTIFFAIWVARVFFRTLRVSFDRRDPTGMTLRFVALYLCVWIISYWFGAQTVGSFLPVQFALAAALNRLRDGGVGKETNPVRSSSPALHPLTNNLAAH